MMSVNRTLEQEKVWMIIWMLRGWEGLQMWHQHLDVLLCSSIHDTKKKYELR